MYSSNLVHHARKDHVEVARHNGFARRDAPSPLQCEKASCKPASVLRTPSDFLCYAKICHVELARCNAKPRAHKVHQHVPLDESRQTSPRHSSTREQTSHRSHSSSWSFVSVLSARARAVLGECHPCGPSDLFVRSLIYFGDPSVFAHVTRVDLCFSLFVVTVVEFLHPAAIGTQLFGQRHVLSHCHGSRDGDKRTIDFRNGNITVVDAEHVRSQRGTGNGCSAITLHKFQVQAWERCRDHWSKASERPAVLFLHTPFHTLPAIDATSSIAADHIHTCSFWWVRVWTSVSVGKTVGCRSFK